MKSLFALLFLSFFISPASYAAFIQHCSNYTPPNASNPVSFTYESCVNRNFNELARYTNHRVFIQRCHNFGNVVQNSFVSCMNRNFNNIQSALRPRPILRYCSNFTPRELDHSYQACINNNFRALQHAVRRQY